MSTQLTSVVVGITGAPSWQRRVGGMPVSATPRSSREVEVHVLVLPGRRESWEVALMVGNQTIGQGLPDDAFEFVATVAVDPTDGIGQRMAITGALPVMAVHVFRRRLA